MKGLKGLKGLGRDVVSLAGEADTVIALLEDHQDQEDQEMAVLLLLVKRAAKELDKARSIIIAKCSREEVDLGY